MYLFLRFFFLLSPLYYLPLFSIHSFRFWRWKSMTGLYFLENCASWLQVAANACLPTAHFFAVTAHSASGLGDIVESVDRNWRLQPVSGALLSAGTRVRSWRSFLLWRQKMKIASVGRMCVWCNIGGTESRVHSSLRLCNRLWVKYKLVCVMETLDNVYFTRSERARESVWKRRDTHR